MGSCASGGFVVNENMPGQGANVIVTAGKLKLKRSDLDRMFKGFCSIDVDRSGLISVHEFIIMNQVQSAMFGELAFRVFDKNNSGKVDFLEYIVALWNYCSLSKESLSLFTFQIFDVDHSGSLSLDEVKHMVDVVWGFHKNDHVDAALKSLDKNHDGLIHLKEFISMVHHTPVLLFPAFELQEKLRTKVLGAAAWDRISKSRVEAYGNGSVFEIIEKCLETDEEYVVAKTIDVASRNPKAPAGFADRVRRMSIERRQRKAAVDQALANNAAIDAGIRTHHPPAPLSSPGPARSHSDSKDSTAHDDGGGGDQLSRGVQAKKSKKAAASPLGGNGVVPR